MVKAATANKQSYAWLQYFSSQHVMLQAFAKSRYAHGKRSAVKPLANCKHVWPIKYFDFTGEKSFTVTKLVNSTHCSLIDSTQLDKNS